MKNMDNFYMMEGMRQQEKIARDKKEKQKREENKDEILRQYSGVVKKEKERKR